MHDQIDRLQERPQHQPAPSYQMPEKAGYKGSETLVCKVLVSRLNGKTTGFSRATDRINFTRLEVERVVTLDKWLEAQQEANPGVDFDNLQDGQEVVMSDIERVFRARAGKRDEDKWYRPEKRLTLRLPVSPPPGLSSSRPWHAGTTIIRKILDWAEMEVVRFRNHQAGMIIIVAVEEIREVPSSSTKYDDYDEGVICGIIDAEAVTFEENLEALETIDNDPFAKEKF